MAWPNDGECPRFGERPFGGRMRSPWSGIDGDPAGDPPSASRTGPALVADRDVEGAVTNGRLTSALVQARAGEFDRFITPSVLKKLEQSGAVRDGKVDWALGDQEFGSDALRLLRSWLAEKLKGAQ